MAAAVFVSSLHNLTSYKDSPRVFPSAEQPKNWSPEKVNSQVTFQDMVHFCSKSINLANKKDPESLAVVSSEFSFAGKMIKCMEGDWSLTRNVVRIGAYITSRNVCILFICKRRQPYPSGGLNVKRKFL